PYDEQMMQEVAMIKDPSTVKFVPLLSHPKITEIDNEIDDLYLKEITPLQHYQSDNIQFGRQLSIVYTSLHGTGITMIPKVLNSWGFSTISLVEKQIIPDGDFPTAPVPNPEELSALQLGIEQMLLSKADLLIATDPDADRVGIACMHHGKAEILTGNQIAAICLEHICEALTKQSRFPVNGAFIKTIGTTELFQAICDHYYRPCFNVLTGFKYIGEKISEWESQNNKYQFIFGAEESYGFLLSSKLARDKDALISSALICEVTLQAKRQGKTLLDKLHDLYRRQGVHQEKLFTLDFHDTQAGREQILTKMQRLRYAFLREINGTPISFIEDYLISTRYHLSSNHQEPLSLPISDTLLFRLEDGSKIMIRPSGTESKLKIYVGAVKKVYSDVEEGIQSCNVQCQEMLTWIQHYFLG
ncbi:MAG: phospho-sugar mutase, partial [Chlamydiales bacterium]